MADGDFTLKDTLRLMKQLPDQVNTWVRAAQKKALVEFRDRKEYPGVACRFNQASNDRSSKGRTFLATSGKGPYGFATRGYALRGQVIDDNAHGARKYLQRNHGTPPFVFTGTMRNELAARMPKTRTTGDVIVTKLSINHRAVNLFAGKHGILRREPSKRAMTYMMTCYRDAVNRTGAFKKQVTRVITQYRFVFSSTTYGQEWKLRSDEIAWYTNRSEEMLTRIVRGAVFTKGGRLRSAYTGSLGVYT